MRNYKNNYFVISEEDYVALLAVQDEFKKSSERIKRTNDKSVIFLEEYYQSMCLHSFGLRLVLNRDNPNILGNVSSQYAEYVNSFFILIENNCKKERNVSFYADELSISTSTLTKVTTELMGKTPVKLIAEETISQIIGASLKPNITNATIAESFGFSDTATLYDILKLLQAIKVFLHFSLLSKKQTYSSQN